MKKVIMVLGIFLVLAIGTTVQAGELTELEKQVKIWATEYIEKLNANDVAGAMAVLEEHPTLIIGITDHGLDLLRLKCANENQATACLKPLEIKKEYTPDFELDPVCMARFDIALDGAYNETDPEKKAYFQSIIQDSMECVSDENMLQLMQIRKMFYENDCKDVTPPVLGQEFQQYIMASPWPHEQHDVARCLTMSDGWAAPKTYQSNLHLAVNLMDSALEVDPDNLQLLLGSGDLHYYLDHLDISRDRFSRAVQIAPDNALVNHFLADLIILQRNSPTETEWQTALNHYQTAEKNYDPKYFEYKIVRCNVMAIKARLGQDPPDFETISACYERINQIYPETTGVTEFNSVNMEIEAVYQQAVAMARNDLDKKTMLRNLLIVMPKNWIRLNNLLQKRHQLTRKNDNSLPNYGIFTSKASATKFVLVIVDYKHDKIKGNSPLAQNGQ